MQIKAHELKIWKAFSSHTTLHCMFPGLLVRFSGSYVWQCRLCPGMKGMGPLYWPDVSQDLRPLGRRFRLAKSAIALTTGSPLSGTSCWQALKEEVLF